MNPDWIKKLQSLEPVTVTCKYDPTPIVDWPRIFKSHSTITANGVTVPVEMKDVLEKDGTVTATMVFTDENYEILKKAMSDGKEENPTT